jgi:hypothetical protein
MKDALSLLLTKLAEWVGYPTTQLKELYAPLDLLMRDAITLFALYPDVLLAPEGAGKTSERQLRKAREDAEKVMEQAEILNMKMAELIRAKWDLVDRDDLDLFASFLEDQLRLRHASKAALELEPAIAFNEAFARRIHAKADAKRRWPWVWVRRPKPYPERHRFSNVMVLGPTTVKKPATASASEQVPSASFSPNA